MVENKYFESSSLSIYPIIRDSRSIEYSDNGSLTTEYNITTQISDITDKKDYVVTGFVPSWDAENHILKISSGTVVLHGYILDLLSEETFDIEENISQNRQNNIYLVLNIDNNFRDSHLVGYDTIDVILNNNNEKVQNFAYTYSDLSIICTTDTWTEDTVRNKLFLKIGEITYPNGIFTFNAIDNNAKFDVSKMSLTLSSNDSLSKSMLISEQDTIKTGSFKTWLESDFILDDGELA